MIPLAEIENLSFVQEFPRACVRRLARMANLREIDRGQVLFTEGSVWPCAYLILQGEVALHCTPAGQTEVRLQTVGPGELLGWSPVLRLGPMTATAVSLTPCRLAVLDCTELLAACDQDTRFGVKVMRGVAVAVADRLYVTRQQLLQSVGDAVQPPCGL